MLSDYGGNTHDGPLKKPALYDIEDIKNAGNIL
jgi:hypothetical protein